MNIATNLRKSTVAGIMFAICIAITALLAFALVPAQEAYAAPKTVKTSATFTVDGNTYKITDRWKSAKDPGEVVLVKYGSSNTKPVINTVKYQGKIYEVEEIGKGAFNNAKGHKITSVKLGRNVEKIQSKAFFGCNKLTVIDISKSEVVEVDYSRKTRTYYLDEVEIGAQAFTNAGTKNVKVKCGNSNAKYQQVVKKALVSKGLRNSATVIL